MRIYDGKVELDAERVKAFFEERGRKLNPENPLTSVMYQDRHPELAEARDAHEKKEVLPLLKLSPADSVLDLGCGIGRWADALAERVARYHGVDFSDALIEQARARHEASHVSFQPLAVEEVAPEKLSVEGPYSRVMIAGVLMYLNDAQLGRSLEGASACSAPSSVLYIREPIATERRLTLKEFWSEELGSAYNAIYRTRDELMQIFERVLGKSGFRLLSERDLYPPELNNRTDTRQRIFLFERP
ncbi:hypothetical protein D3C72_110810 [compost metagenome]